jgi:hypothetical protein
MLSYHDEEEERAIFQQESEHGTVPKQDDDPANTPRIPSRRRSLNIHCEQWCLSEEEKSLFKGNMDDNYLLN